MVGEHLEGHQALPLPPNSQHFSHDPCRQVLSQAAQRLLKPVCHTRTNCSSSPPVTKRVPCATPKAAWQHHILKAEKAAAPTFVKIQGISQHSPEGRSPCPKRVNTPECHKARLAAIPAGKGQRSWNDINSTPFPNAMLTTRPLERESLKAHFTHTHTLGSFSTAPG